MKLLSPTTSLQEIQETEEHKWSLSDTIRIQSANPRLWETLQHTTQFLQEINYKGRNKERMGETKDQKIFKK